MSGLKFGICLDGLDRMVACVSSTLILEDAELASPCLLGSTCVFVLQCVSITWHVTANGLHGRRGNSCGFIRCNWLMKDA